MSDCSVDDLVEVVRENLGCQSDCDTLGALRKQKRELDRQFHGLLVTAVVRGHPVGCLRVEHNLLGELGETRLDVTGSGV